MQDEGIKLRTTCGHVANQSTAATVDKMLIRLNDVEANLYHHCSHELCHEKASQQKAEPENWNDIQDTAFLKGYT